MTTNYNGSGPGQVTPENDNGRNPLQVAPVKTLYIATCYFIAKTAPYIALECYVLSVTMLALAVSILGVA